MDRSKHALIVSGLIGAVLAWGVGEVIGGWAGRLVGVGILLAVLTVLVVVGRNTP